MKRQVGGLCSGPVFWAVLCVCLVDAFPLSPALAQEDSLSWKFWGTDQGWQQDVWQSTGPGEQRAVVQELPAENFQVSVDVQVLEANAQAGIVFRSDAHRQGVDGYQGDYVGIDLRNETLIWGRVEEQWRELARKRLPLKIQQWYRLTLVVQANRVRVAVAGRDLGSEIKFDQAGLPIAATTVSAEWFPLDGKSTEVGTGRIGLRSLGGRVQFRNFEVSAAEEPPAKAKGYVNPLVEGCADPVVKRFGDTYYLYCTDSKNHPDMPVGIRVLTSPDLVNWKDCGYALRKADSWGERQFWAPDIVFRDGVYYLYYAAETRICVATAKSPLGPFHQEVKAPMQPDSIRIDAHVFRDDDGQYYFYYVHFHNGNEIWGGRLNDDMISVDPKSLRKMIAPDQDWERQQAAIAEGPEVIKHDGVYYLTYSGSHFESPDYAVGYATSESPLGPWTKSEFNPVMKSTAYAHGTAHHCLTTSPDGKEHFIVYHRHFSLTETEPRQLSIDRFRFVPQAQGPDRLEILGPTSTQQPMPAR